MTQSVGDALRLEIERALPRLLEMGEAESAARPKPDKWSARELLGHLIDSASNNHQRFVRAQVRDDLIFEGYDQEKWVRAQGYAEAPWAELVGLWRAYNLHLARVIDAVPAAVRKRRPAPYIRCQSKNPNSLVRSKICPASWSNCISKFG